MMDYLLVLRDCLLFLAFSYVEESGGNVAFGQNHLMSFL